MRVANKRDLFWLGLLLVVAVVVPFMPTAWATTLDQKMLAAFDGSGNVKVTIAGSNFTFDASNNLSVTLGTGLNGTDDSVSIRVANLVPGLLTADADGQSNTFNGIQVLAYEHGFNGSQWDRIASAAASPAGTEKGLVVRDLPIGSNLIVSTTGSAAAAVTLTIPSVASDFHYISGIIIEEYTTAARTGGATPVICTTTNLPGSPTVSFDTAQGAGVQIDRYIWQPTGVPVKSTTVNTNTTVVCPATTSIIWNITATYYAAP